MSKFTPEKCRELLQNVSMTEKAVHAAGAKFVFWKRHAEDVVKLWDQEFRAADMEKRLMLVYVADATVQTAKQQGPQLAEAFAPILPEALRHMLKHSDTKTQQRLKHVVKVWRQRNIWGARLQAKFDALVQGVQDEEAPAAAAAPAPAGAAQAGATDPYSTLQQQQAHIVDLSKRGQLLMAADAQARKQLDSATSQGASSEALQPLLDTALAKATELNDINTQRIAAEEALHQELARLLEAKAGDMQRCRARAEASASALQQLQARQGGPHSPVRPAVASSATVAHMLTSPTTAGMALPPDAPANGTTDATAVPPGLPHSNGAVPSTGGAPGAKVDPRRAARQAAAAAAQATAAQQDNAGAGAAPAHPPSGLPPPLPSAQPQARQGIDDADMHAAHAEQDTDPPLPEHVDPAAMAAAELAALAPDGSANLLQVTLAGLDKDVANEFLAAMTSAATGQ